MLFMWKLATSATKIKEMAPLQKLAHTSILDGPNLTPAGLQITVFSPITSYRSRSVWRVEDIVQICGAQVAQMLACMFA